MERQEPRFDKDMQDAEFRPRSCRGPSWPPPSRDNDGLAWKIGVTVSVGVFAALLIFNAYERHQARRDAEEALRLIQQETAKLEREMQAAIRSAAVPLSRPARLPLHRRHAAVPRRQQLDPDHRAVQSCLLFARW